MSSPSSSSSPPPPSSTQNRGNLFDLNQQLDQPLDLEAARLRSAQVKPALTALFTIRFAFQSLGIVYGDLGTSPLYVFHSIFPDGFTPGREEEELMGALSLIIYTLFLIPLVKYTLIVMRANDNGEGGTFALYSLICRHAKTNTIPNQHPTDQALTTYSTNKLDKKSIAGKTKKWLEGHGYSQRILMFLVLVGTSMLIGDGILTPAISVLSSVGGIQVNKPHVKEDWIVVIACFILLLLFSVQKLGTDRVSWLFAPAVFIWFLSVGAIGIFNIIKHDHMVLKSFSPVYIIRYFSSKPKRKWVSLGGVLLSITGTEALYADVGHFSVLSVQIAFGCFVFPCLLAAYVGQAAYLSKYPHDVTQAFYRSIPGRVYWPMFVIATLAAIIASQATISATFSIIKQSVALGCFPRVKVVHTSHKHYGQVYIPEINWILMVLCIIITAGFKETIQIGNAYGIAVVILMIVTTILMALVMLLVWRTNFLLIFLFTVIYLVVELILLSAMLFKFDQGGWAPLAIAALFLLVMYTWHYGTLKKYEIEKQNKVPLSWILGLGPSLGLVRVPGIGLVYSELAHGVPSIFSHFVTHLPAIHSVVVFVCIKYLPVNRVPAGERFLFRRIGPKEFRLYRCVARYGYKDLHKKDDMFEESLLENLAYYIRDNALSEGSSVVEESEMSDASARMLRVECAAEVGSVQFEQGSSNQDSIVTERSTGRRQVRFAAVEAMDRSEGEEEEEEEEEESLEDLGFLQEARQAGVVHILGDVVVRAKRDSNVAKKFLVDYVYAMLRRICRENSVVLNIPHESLFNVGQVYYI